MWHYSQNPRDLYLSSLIVASLTVACQRLHTASSTHRTSTTTESPKS